MSQTQAAPRTLSIGRTAMVFTALGPVAGPFLFAVFVAIAGIWNMGLGAPLVAIGYFIWFLPFFYVALALPFLLTGIVYATAARRLERPSLLVALVSGAGVFAACLGVLTLAAWIAGEAGFPEYGLKPEDTSPRQVLSNLGSLMLAMAIGVLPSWWFTRDRRAAAMWI